VRQWRGGSGGTGEIMARVGGTGETTELTSGARVAVTEGGGGQLGKA
jgi:hypothetical protein